MLRGCDMHSLVLHMSQPPEVLSKYASTSTKPRVSVYLSLQHSKESELRNHFFHSTFRRHVLGSHQLYRRQFRFDTFAAHMRAVYKSTNDTQQSSRQASQRIHILFEISERLSRDYYASRTSHQVCRDILNHLTAK